MIYSWMSKPHEAEYQGYSAFNDGTVAYLAERCRDLSVLSLCDCVKAAIDKALKVGNTAGVSNGTANTMMQRFRDSAMPLAIDDDDRGEGSLKLASEAAETRSPSASLPNTFAFKIQDRKKVLTFQAVTVATCIHC